jgi:hypothetical protein
VCHRRLSTTATQVAAVIYWLVEQGGVVINLSLGLRQNRPVRTVRCLRTHVAYRRPALRCQPRPLYHCYLTGQGVRIRLSGAPDQGTR